MKVWISKYALTKGIYEAEVEGCFDISPRMIKIGHWYFHGDDWHHSRELAMAKAEEMRVAKIKSLQKSLKKFEAMRFL